MNGPDACPHSILMKTLKESVPWFWTNNCPPTVCTSAMVLPVRGSKTIHKGINTIWQTFWIATIINEGTSDTLILRTRCGLTTTIHKVNSIARKENIQHYQSKEVQYAATSRKNDADTFMGLKSTNPGTLFTEGYNSQQCLLQRDALGLVETSQSNGIPRNGDEGCSLLHDNFNLHTAIHTAHTFWPTEL